MTYKPLLHDMMMRKADGSHPALYDAMSREQLLCAAFFSMKQRFMRIPASANPIDFFSSAVIGDRALGELADDELRVCLDQYEDMRRGE